MVLMLACTYTVSKKKVSFANTKFSIDKMCISSADINMLYYHMQ